jgi:hypothetical protein
MPRFKYEAGLDTSSEDTGQEDYLLAMDIVTLKTPNRLLDRLRVVPLETFEYRATIYGDWQQLSALPTTPCGQDTCHMQGLACRKNFSHINIQETFSNVHAVERAD